MANPNRGRTSVPGQSEGVFITTGDPANPSNIGSIAPGGGLPTSLATALFWVDDGAGSNLLNADGLRVTFTNASVTTLPSFTTVTTSFTAAAQTFAGNPIGSGALWWALQVYNLAGVPTSWDIRIEAQLTGGNAMTTMVQHTTADGLGITKSNATALLATDWRLRVAALTLGGAGNIGVLAIVRG